MAFPFAALSEPTLGTLIGPEGHILDYKCLPLDENASDIPGSRITCDFVQVLLNQVLEPSDFEAQMTEMLAAISSEQSEIEDLCSQLGPIPARLASSVWVNPAALRAAASSAPVM